MSSSDSDRSSSRRRSNKSDRSRSRDRDNRKYGRDRKVKVKVPELGGSYHSFKQFSMLQTEKMTPEVLQKCYDKYKKQWEQRQHEEFFNSSKTDAWFNEKYNPQFLDLQQREKKELTKNNYLEFINKTQEHHFDPIDLRITDVSQIGMVYEQDEDDDYNQNFNSFLSNQTIEVVLDNTVDITKAPYFGFDPDHATLFIKGISKEISRYDIKHALTEVQGWRNIIMSDPSRKTGFSRNCWIEFNNEEQCQKALTHLNGLLIKQTALIASKAYTKLKRIKVLKNYPLSRLALDIDAMKKLIQKLDARMEIEQNHVILTKKYPTLQKEYDTLLLYLRKVHYFDFYNCTQFDNQRMITLKTGSIFLRIQADYEELQNTQTVFKKIKENADKKTEQMGECIDYLNMLKDEVQKFVKDSKRSAEEESKGVWKCPLCEKKFKTSEFLAKHLITRHDEIKTKKLETVMQQLYMKDPNKITGFYIRDDNKMKKSYNSNYSYMRRQEKKRENYRDFDEPENEAVKKPVVGAKPMINFLDI